MDDIEALRRRKIEHISSRLAAGTAGDSAAGNRALRAAGSDASIAELNNAYSKQLEDQEQLQSQIAMLENAVKSVLSNDAIARYNNLKLGHPDKAVRLLLIIGNAMHSGEIPPGAQITDKMLKQLLAKLTPEKREVKITKL